MSPKLMAVVVWLAVLAAAMIGVARLTGGKDDDGGALALGQTAVVEYTESTSGGSPGAATTLAVTITGVRKGTQQELKQGGLEIDEADRNATPYYVDARYGNSGQRAVKRNIDVSLEDSKGESVPRTLIFGFGDKPYEPCTNVTKGTLKPGESYQSCTLVLVPEGRDVKKVLFVSQKANAEIVFTYWKAAAT